MEEKIIDGVDVAGCRNYKHNAENIGWSMCLSKDEEHYHSNNPLCCEKKDCLYKQLKRLEQERDKYKHALEEIKAELKDDLTCESRECGCDDYGECLECLKETILNIITEAIGE